MTLKIRFKRIPSVFRKIQKFQYPFGCTAESCFSVYMQQSAHWGRTGSFRYVCMRNNLNLIYTVLGTNFSFRRIFRNVDKRAASDRSKRGLEREMQERKEQFAARLSEREECFRARRSSVLPRWYSINTRQQKRSATHNVLSARKTILSTFLKLGSVFLTYTNNILKIIRDILKRMNWRVKIYRGRL